MFVLTVLDGIGIGIGKLKYWQVLAKVSKNRKYFCFRSFNTDKYWHKSAKIGNIFILGVLNGINKFK